MARNTPSRIEPSPSRSRWANTASAWRSISSVSSSTNHEPPSGSATFATPVSSAITCWVRNAMRAAFSVGRASTSSIEFVCRLCVPPRTPASASMAVRTMLTSGCCAVSDTPAVWVWNRSCSERSARAPYRSRIHRAQMRRAARYLAISSKKSMCALKKKDSRGANSSTARPAAVPASTYAKPFASVNASSWAAVLPASRMW